MTLQKYKQMADKTHDLTSNGKLEWKESVVEGDFQVAFPEYSIQISMESRGIYQLAIIDSGGRVLDSFTDVDLDESTPGEYDQKMGEIYRIARRYALGIEQAIDSILSDLKQLDDIPS